MKCCRNIEYCAHLFNTVLFLRNNQSFQRIYGSRLIVLRGEPVSTLSSIFTASGSSASCSASHVPFTCDAIVWEEEAVEPYGLKRDAAVAAAAAKHGISAKAVPGGHHLWDPSVALAALGPSKSPPMSMNSFQTLASKLGPVSAPIAPPESLPPLPSNLLEQLSSSSSADELLPPESLCDLPAFAEDPDALRILSHAEGAKGGHCYGLVGGETAGLTRLNALIGNKARDDWVASFEKPKTRSTGFDGTTASSSSSSSLIYGGGMGNGGNGGPATTLLSPYLKFGCVSARKMHETLQESYARTLAAEGKEKPKSPPTSLLGQLYFREIAYLQAKYRGEAFEQTPSPVCVDIPWLPLSSTNGKSDGGVSSVSTTEGDRRLAAWENGRTGYPYIDACMRQLRETGWLHHLGRHAVACFLTRGDLWVSWTAGRDVFDKYLLDADWAVNNFNWLWLAGVAPWSSPFFRVYSPMPNPKTSSLNVMDPDGHFVKRFVPELRAMPAKYIYSPWTAPSAVQANTAKCLVGDTKPPPSLFSKVSTSSSSPSASQDKNSYLTYPGPIVDHKTQSKENIARFKAALDQNRAAKAKSKSSASSKNNEPVKKKAKKSD